LQSGEGDAKKVGVDSGGCYGNWPKWSYNILLHQARIEASLYLLRNATYTNEPWKYISKQDKAYTACYQFSTDFL
jgi:hypothetical protein